MLHPDFDGFFYHATSAHKAKAILQDGLAPGSFLATDDLADYYAETVRDEGQDAVILKVDASNLDAFALTPDMPGLEEPISTVIGLSEDDIWEAWEQSPRTWRSCFALIGSIQSTKRIPPELITLDE